jgi:hypothetical protein
MSEPSDKAPDRTSAKVDLVQPRVIQRSADLQKLLLGVPGQQARIWTLQQAAKNGELARPAADPANNGGLAIASGSDTPILTDSELARPLSSPQRRTARVGSQGDAQSFLLLSEPASPRQRPPRALGSVVSLISGLGLGAGLMWLIGTGALLPSGAVDVAGRSADIESEPVNDTAGPAYASQWHPVLLTEPPATITEPQPTWDVQGAARSSSAVYRTRSAQTLAAPISADKLPSLVAELPAGDALLGVTSLAQTSAVAPESVRPQVVMHVSPDLSQAARDQAESTLRSAGFDLTSSSVAGHSVAASQVFFFHQEDAPNATRVAEAIGARVRDFSAFRPAPEQGRLEVWLAQEG